MSRTSNSKGKVVAFLNLLALVEGENIFTLFRVTYDSKKVAPDQVVDRVRRKVRRWGRTATGQRAQVAADGDFNWGDLASYTSGHPNRAIPWTNGIIAVEAILLTSSQIVAHDELLMQTPARKNKSASAPITSSNGDLIAKIDLALAQPLIDAAKEAYSGMLLDNPNDYIAQIILNVIESGVGSASKHQTAGDIAAAMLESDAEELKAVAESLHAVK